MSQSPSGFAGFQEPSVGASKFNEQAFLFKQFLSRVETATLVKVVAVTNSGGIAPSGYVDVQPMVNQVDGGGNATPHGTVYHLPYSRIQGGGNGVIMDPQVGDMGIAVFASRDISSVKANKGVANPGSHRRHSMADGMYVGGALNGVPTQYIAFTSDGVVILSPHQVTVQAPRVIVTSDDVEISGVALKHNGVNVGSTHVHAGVQPGSGRTGLPL